MPDARPHLETFMLRIRLPLALAAGALLLAPPVQAQDPPFGGTFVLDREASDTLETVVDRGVELVVSWWRRPFARGRLAESNRPYEWTRISSADGGVTVETDQWALEIPWDGGIEGWERTEGDFVDVTAAVEGRLLRLTFRGEDGRRTNVYRLAGAGQTLVVDVTITSELLRGPLTYQLVYRREAPASTP